MHPMMHHLVHEISVANPKNKVVGVFGSSSWNGAGVKTLKKELEAIKITPTEKSVELFGVTTGCEGVHSRLCKQTIIR